MVMERVYFDPWQYQRTVIISYINLKPQEDTKEIVDSHVVPVCP